MHGDAGLIVEMGDGECEAVGGIVLGFLGKAEEGLNHFLHLRFFSGAPAGGGHFDRAGLVFIDRDTESCALRNHHATRMRENHHGLDVLRIEDAFDCGDIGMMRLDEFGKLILQMDEASGEGACGRILNGAIPHGNHA